MCRLHERAGSYVNRRPQTLPAIEIFRKYQYCIGIGIKLWENIGKPITNRCQWFIIR
jgi:hypothetical protein